MDELFRLGALDVVRGLHERRFSCVDVVSASLARIAALDDRYQAFLTVALESALRRAEQADRALAMGETVGPLHGLPVALKDLVDTEGIRTTYGSALFRDHVPDSDDIIAVRLKAAGAIIVGKTNTPEFGYGAITDNELRGPTRNPYDPLRTSGGSSGGSAVAVCLGMVPVAHGTDFAGSVRFPASFCALVGLRPTIGRIPTVPKSPLWQNLIAHGVLARTVEDAALVLTALAGRDDRDPVSYGDASWQSPDFSAAHKTAPAIAVSADLGFALIDGTVRRLFDRAVEQIGRIFPKTAPVELSLGDVKGAFETLRGALLFDQFGPMVAEHGERLSETLRWNVERGRNISAADLYAAERSRSRIYLELLSLLERYDILATISAPVPPFPNAHRNVLSIDGKPLRHIIDWFGIATPVTVTGLPALSLPCGWTDDGLPVGLQLIARPYAEADLLLCAYRLQEKLGFRHRWPAAAAEPPARDQAPT
jgi:amidase